MSDLRERMRNFLCDELFKWAFGDDDDDQETEFDLLPRRATLALAPSRAPTSTTHNQPNPLPLTLPLPVVPAPCAPAPTSSTRRFTLPKRDAEVCAEQILGVPQKNQEDTKYCFHFWEEWRTSREKSTGVNINNLTQMFNHELQHWLTRFILEVRKQDGSTPTSLHHIAAGVMTFDGMEGQI